MKALKVAKLLRLTRLLKAAKVFSALKLAAVALAKAKWVTAALGATWTALTVIDTIGTFEWMVFKALSIW